MTLDSQIEAILFSRPEPLRIGVLADMLNLTGEDGIVTVHRSLDELRGRLVGRGIRLVSHDDTVMLATAPEAGELLEHITKAELKKDLGKASVETLTIILYKNPVSKSEIDYIRGVNAGFILRNLLIRGLIERLPNPNDKRTFLYAPSINLLAHLGITQVDELPDYEQVAGKIEAFEEDFAQESDKDEEDQVDESEQEENTEEIGSNEPKNE